MIDQIDQIFVMGIDTQGLDAGSYIKDESFGVITRLEICI